MRGEGSELLFGGRLGALSSIHPTSIPAFRLDRGELLHPKDCRPIRFHRCNWTEHLLIAPLSTRLVFLGAKRFWHTLSLEMRPLLDRCSTPKFCAGSTPPPMLRKPVQTAGPARQPARR